MKKYQDTVFGTGGPVFGAVVTVYLTGTTTKPTIYSDNGVTPKANPMSTDVRGHYEFYVADGVYDIKAEKSGFGSTTITEVTIDDLSSISEIGPDNDSQHAIPDVATDSFVLLNAVQTLKNKTIEYIAPGAGAVPTSIASKLNNYVSVKDYGATGNGSTNDYAAIQAAIDAIESAGTGGFVFFPPGSYKINTGLRIKKGVKLVGSGYGDGSSAATQPTTPATSLLGGTADMTMVLIQGANSGDIVWNAGVIDIALKGSNTAGRGVYARSIKNGEFYFWCERVKNVGFEIDDGNDALSAFIHVIFYQYVAGTNINAQPSHGFIAQETTGNGITQIAGDYIRCDTVDGNGYSLGDVDSAVFTKVQCNATGTGKDIWFRGDDGDQVRPSRKNIIVHAAGRIEADTGSKNLVCFLNSEGSAVQLNGDAICHYTVLDRNNGETFQTRRYAMDAFLPLVGHKYPVSNPAADGLAGATGVPSISFTAAATNTVLWSVGIPDTWAAGTISGIDAGKFVRFTVSLQTRKAGGGLGSWEATVSANVAASATNNTLVTTEIASSLAYATGDMIFVQLSREGADVADDATGNCELLSARLHYVSTGPASDPTPNYDAPPMSN
jgi:hypothetical protein